MVLVQRDGVDEGVAMGMRDRLEAGLARQLGHPSGLRGRLVASRLNKSNRDVVLAAVDAAAIGPGQSVADLGFGGGVGLQPLLDKVGPTGHVDGVDIAETMLEVARRRFAADVARGGLTLHNGTMTALPLGDGVLDAAITVNTVYFVEDLARAFSELSRVVRPGGRAVVAVGDPESMREMSVTAHGFRLRPVDELAAQLESVGFRTPSRHRVGSDDGAFHLLVAVQLSGTTDA